MKYLLLIYHDENAHANWSQEALQTEMTEYNAFSTDIFAKGVAKGGDALHPTSAATTVRIRDGKTLVTDGPFAETKEQLGGYYVVDCKDLNEAIEWAGKIPGAKVGSIEVRPIVEFSM